MTNFHNQAKYLVIVTVLMAIGAGSFCGARALTDGGQPTQAGGDLFPRSTEEPSGEPPQATPPDTGEPGGVPPQATPPAEPPQVVPLTSAEEIRLLEEEQAKPRFEGVVNGIKLVTDPSHRDLIKCDYKYYGNVNQNVALADVPRTDLDFSVGYLPEGAVLGSYSTTTCEDGRGALVYRSYEVWTTFGSGFVSVLRYRGGKSIAIDASADLVKAATVAGKPAVLVEPLHESGFLQAGIVMAEDDGLTVISGMFLPMSELIKVAEGLR